MFDTLFGIWLLLSVEDAADLKRREQTDKNEDNNENNRFVRRRSIEKKPGIFCVNPLTSAVNLGYQSFYKALFRGMTTQRQSFRHHEITIHHYHYQYFMRGVGTYERKAMRNVIYIMKFSPLTAREKYPSRAISTLPISSSPFLCHAALSVSRSPRS